MGIKQGRREQGWEGGRTRVALVLTIIHSHSWDQDGLRSRPMGTIGNGHGKAHGTRITTGCGS